MKFPGYWVSNTVGKVSIEQTTFDETELDPANNWKQAWQNQEADSTTRGYVDLSAALGYAASLLAKAEGRTLGQTEMTQVKLFSPNWKSSRCDIHSLSDFFSQDKNRITSQS